MDIAQHQRHGGLHSFLRRGIVGGRRLSVLQDAFKAEDAEVGPPCGEVGVGHFADTVESHNSIIDSATSKFDSCDKGMTSEEHASENGG